MSLPKLSRATALVSSTLTLSVLWLGAAVSAQTVDAHPTSELHPAGESHSKVRIVRLSQIKGDVQMDRAIGRGMEPATANLPVIEQSRIETAMGVAEVELEDNSTLRLAPNSAVEFPKLGRMPNGATQSWVRLLKGTAYVSLLKAGGIQNDFIMLVGEQRLALNGGTHVRLQVMAPEMAKLAVMDGAVQVQGTSGAIEVAKKHTATFSLMGTNDPGVEKQLASEPLDGWDKEAVNYHARMAVMSGFGNNNSPYAYGMNDLAYYGSFMNAGSCGTMWRPYFASAAWDPYSNGTWAYYGGAAGYSWVSPYPWGWMPYHYGSWSMCPGVGWGWMPGGAWNGLNNVGMFPVQTGPGSGGFRRFVPPVRPPAAHEPTLVPVNMKPLVRSELKSLDSFEFRRDSAGLGIPRGTMGKLNGVSRETISRGTATTEIYVTAPNQGVMGPRSGSLSGSGDVFGASIHRGPAGPRMGDTSQRSPYDGSASTGLGNSSMSNGSMRSGGSSPQPVTSRPAGGPSGPSGGGSRPK